MPWPVSIQCALGKCSAVSLPHSEGRVQLHRDSIFKFLRKLHTDVNFHNVFLLFSPPFQGFRP